MYLRRCKCEQACGFLKDSYNIKDARARSYVGSRDPLVLAHPIVCFVSVLIAARAKLNLIRKRLCDKAKQFYEVAVFFQYVAAGPHLPNMVCLWKRLHTTNRPPS